MKKVMAALLTMCLLAGGVVAQPYRKTVEFSLNIGVQTPIRNGSLFSQIAGTLDVRLGINLSRSFQVSPEFLYAMSSEWPFELFKYGYTYPGVVLNYRAKNFFVGAGLVFPHYFEPGVSDSGHPAPKLNVGYGTRHLLLTLYMIVSTTESANRLNLNEDSLGATVGYRF